MIITRPIIISALLLFAASTSCVERHMNHMEVAQTFVGALSEYKSKHDKTHLKQLTNISSEYTMQLITSSDMASKFAPDHNFQYLFVRDSLSPDKMRAFVFYVNAYQCDQITLYKLPLRQSLKGWVVDIPII